MIFNSNINRKERTYVSLLFILIILESGFGCLLHNFNINQYVINNEITIRANIHENMKDII